MVIGLNFKTAKNISDRTIYSCLNNIFVFLRAQAVEKKCLNILIYLAAINFNQMQVGMP